MARFPRLRRERPINASNPTPAPKVPDTGASKEPGPKVDPAAPKVDPAAPKAGPTPSAEPAKKPPAASEKPKGEERRQPRWRRKKAKDGTGKPASAPAPIPAPASGAKKPEPEPEPKDKKPKDAKPAAKQKPPKPPGPPKPPRRPIKLSPGGRLGAAAIGGAAIAVAILAATGTFSSDDDGSTSSSPAPVITRSSGDSGSQAASDLGFPAFATRNTTRIGGSDSASNAAGAALAAFPSTGGARSPIAVSLVSEGDWQTGIAASSLLAPPLGFPVLISGDGDVPDATQQALDALKPRGGALSGGTQAFTLGQASAPDDLRERPVIGDDPAALAADIDRLRTELTGEEPEAILVTTSESSEFAMPAAAYAARSGDPVLFTNSKKLPAATARALGNHKGVPVYVLGPPSVIPDSIIGDISDASGSKANRVSGEDPVSNAVAFARYSQGDFGWNINDPGHGFVVARSDHAMDAAAAAPLSASGTWGPLLLTDNTETLPGALRGYLLDVKPGYRDDPTRALYNHVWVIGSEEAISVDQQAAIDELAELTQIGQPAVPQPGTSDDSGATGASGATGEKGKKGDSGSTGDTGASGATGSRGDDK